MWMYWETSGQGLLLLSLPSQYVSYHHHPLTTVNLQRWWPGISLNNVQARTLGAATAASPFCTSAVTSLYRPIAAPCQCAEPFGLSCRFVMWCCTQMPSTGVVDRSSPLAEEPSMLPSSQLSPGCVSRCTWWRSKHLSRPWEASTVCSTRSVATSLRSCSDQVRLKFI